MSCNRRRGVLLLALLVGPSSGASDPWDVELAPLPPLAGAFGRTSVVSRGVGSSPSAVETTAPPSRRRDHPLDAAGVSDEYTTPSRSTASQTPVALDDDDEEVSVAAGHTEEAAPPHPVPTEMNPQQQHPPTHTTTTSPPRHDVPHRRVQTTPPEVCLAFLSCCGRTDLLEATLAAAVCVKSVNSNCIYFSLETTGSYKQSRRRCDTSRRLDVAGVDLHAVLACMDIP